VGSCCYTLMDITKMEYEEGGFCPPLNNIVFQPGYDVSQCNITFDNSRELQIDFAKEHLFARPRCAEKEPISRSFTLRQHNNVVFKN
jgi:hypothetical protein